MNSEKLIRLAQQVRTGGKGSVRRKKKANHKANVTDDKRLQGTLKRLGVNNIPGIEEVNLFKDDGNVIHFTNPKGIIFHFFFFEICNLFFILVQASIAANTYVVSGHSETKSNFLIT